MKRLLLCLVSPSFLLVGTGCQAPLEGYFDMPESFEIRIAAADESSMLRIGLWHDADGDELLDLPHEVAVVPRAGRDGEPIYLDSLVFGEGEWFGTASGFDASGGRFRQIILNAQDARGWEAGVGVSG